MNEPLIFTEQRVFPRVMDAVLTLVAWLGFSYLIYTGLMVALAESPDSGVRPFYSTYGTVMLYMAVALLIGAVLIGWAKYNQHRFRVERRRRRPGLEKHEVAASFSITPELALELSKARVLTLAHYDTGAIDRVYMAKLLADEPEYNVRR